MDGMLQSFEVAWAMIVAGNDELADIVILSLKTSLIATLIASLMGLFLGIYLAVVKFRFRSLFVIIINAFMGLPPVVVGLVLYILLSNSGPLNFLNLLYTPLAMIIAQVILITPIIIGFSREIFVGFLEEYEEQFLTLGLGNYQIALTIMIEARLRLYTVVAAGFGRAIGEVGAVMIVGGNIEHLTRVMTSAIVLETSRGDLNLALALGILLVLISFFINALVMVIRRFSENN